MDPLTVGVVGAGVIGAGVIQALAETGHRVVAVDVSSAILQACRDSIVQTQRLQRLFKKASTPGPGLDNVVWTTEYAALAETGFVIENVPEKWETKRDVHKMIDAACDSTTVIAANTSAIPIARIASFNSRPERIIGMHFMNPVPLKPIVEMIPAELTSAKTLEEAQRLLTRMGKDWVVVKDSPGFVSNRVLMLTINEAIRVVHEDVAPPEDVDRIFTSCFGHKMGPLATADLIGLDTILLSIEVLHDHFQDTRFQPCPLLTHMVDAGLLGCKSGRGFYNYQTGDRG